MQLVHLSLTNFRNFIRLEMDFPPGPTLVVGPNSQGKTSLLEAIDYLVAADSPRAGSDRELINFLVARQPDAFARIVAEFRRDDRASSRFAPGSGHPGGDRASHPGGDRASSRLRTPEGHPGGGRASSRLRTPEGHPGGDRASHPRGDRPPRIEG